ncbi:MAG TPA: MBL fold metallo-hydrolase [Candidatus Dormibacteraeota bacterium]|jgi:phosphoribosyl 1,2-cyclic phosphodiesterase|nr:MBL fold metallo-hydrolase [Candidatus Dormibacteraeota bacterium]
MPDDAEPVADAQSIRLTFMGVAGARFMVAKQIAASGGIYLEKGKTRLAMDPGPGAVVQYAKRKVDLTRLDGILLSHRHLDHSGDVNVMVEGMTDGGFKPRGTLFGPPDIFDDDPVVLQYLRRFPKELIRLEACHEYRLGDLTFRTSPPHIHGAQTFGFLFENRKLGWVTDSKYYEGIAEDHRAEVMIIHAVLDHSRDNLPHLGLDDAERIIEQARPRLALITHFGMTVWRARPWEVAEGMSQRLGVEVKAARDGMRLVV